MKTSIIVALDSKNGIGKSGQLPWHITQDLKRFKDITTGYPVIMGRKTFESIGRVLPGRLNIVISHNKFKAQEGLFFTGSLEEALKMASEDGKNEIFIIGGGQVFKEALDKNLIDKLYLTLVEGDYNADTFFPDYSNFKIVSGEKGESNGYKYTFQTLER